MKKGIVLLILGVIVLGVGLYFLYSQNFFNEKKDQEPKDDPSLITEGSEFNTAIIKKIHTNNNYLISPYSIEIALNMLKDGAMGDTKEEIEKLVGTRDIKDLRIKDKIGIANAAFIKNNYKNVVKENFYSNLKNKYNADLLFDAFNTPDVINEWVKENTNKMIEKILDEMNPDFAMGLANAIAIDVKWLNPFECFETSSEDFTKASGEKMQVEMMHQYYRYSVSYFDGDEVEGVILPYERLDNDDINLEFVAMLPKGDINSFINGLTKEKLNNFDHNSKEAGDSLNIRLSLPRFKYDFEVKNFIDVLKELGINKAFDSTSADFSNIFDKTKTNDNFYVDTAIHKAIIDLNETGTKAAAVTYFGIEGNGLLQEQPEIKEIVFNKPFAYMIRDKESKEILFFGSVFEPNKWEKETCDNKKIAFNN